MLIDREGVKVGFDSSDSGMEGLYKCICRLAFQDLGKVLLTVRCREDKCETIQKDVSSA